MCGIFGLILPPHSSWNLQKATRVFEELFLLSDSRGKEASGVAVWSDKKLSLLKAPIRGKTLIAEKKYQDLLQDTLSQAFPVSLIGHSRLETNGSHTLNKNNQPVHAGSMTAIHNGIIVNDTDFWEKIPQRKRKTEVDTEALITFIDEKIQQGNSVEVAFQQAFQFIQGSATIATYHDQLSGLIAATNTGSFFYAFQKNEFFLFASEKYIVQQVLKNTSIFEKKYTPTQLHPQSALYIPFQSALPSMFSLTKKIPVSTSKKKQNTLTLSSEPLFTFQEIRLPDSYGLSAKNTHTPTKRFPTRLTSLQKYTLDETKIQALKRCTRCILPETMPLIHFNNQGVCNYCRNHTPIQPLGKKSLEQLLQKHRKKKGEPDCIVALSGGRDSSYGLHYLKKELGLHPIAYSYDWGMLTDIGRRNQARMVGKLGVEHIIVSADIGYKRDNIRKNILAWLKKPDLGMVPLFMAGDKQAEFYAKQLQRKTGIPLVFYCRGNEFENEEFKWGHCGIKNGSPQGVLHNLSLQGKMQLALYYAKHFATNPAYWNSSLVDTAFAYATAYMMPFDFTYLWHYIPWDEKTIISTLTQQYGWEKEPESEVTWRIDDGSVAFYNFIFSSIQGFTENDTFRSNQIREGILTRNQALVLVKKENRPRYKALQWYFQQLNLDGEAVLKKIASIPKLY